VTGTAERPRLSVYRSNRGVFAQLIDDGKGNTVAAVNWIEPELRKLSASEQAKRAGERIYELTQFLVHVAKAHEAGLRGNGTVTYHASCHLTRSLGVREEPLTLLSSLKGATFLPMADAARCCGFGGTFMAKLPEISCALADEKAESIAATGADTVTGCDSGCLMNIADAMRRRRTEIRVVHIAQLLAEGL